MDDFRNIDFTNYLIVFDGNILGISVAPGELMADGDLKKYADCRTPEYAAWINLKQAKMICRIKFAGMDKFSLPFFSENNTINIPEHAFNAIEHMAELLLLPMDGSSGFSAPMALPVLLDGKSWQGLSHGFSSRKPKTKKAAFAPL